MSIYSYHQRAQAFRSEITNLLLIAGFELVVWAILIPLLPSPWNLVVLLLVLGITALILPALVALLRARHRLTHGHLTLAYGKDGALRTWVIRIPLADIAGGGPFPTSPPRRLAPGLLPTYHPEDDTLYLLADRKRLVTLTLKRPYGTRLPKQGMVQFTRVVLTLDQPERFLADLAAAGVPIEGIADSPIHADAPIHAAAPIQADGLTPAIQLAGLAKRFGDLEAVQPLHLAVAPGEVLAFLGSNGAGKTTTIKMMTGLLRPTAGQVLIEGHDLWTEGPAIRQRLGYVPDVPLLYEGLTAQEFLWLMAGLHELPRPEGRRRTGELLALLGMERWADHLIRTFSLGMKRKMAIAAALIHRPRVLLLDEVTNGLDPRAGRDVKDLIASAARSGTAIFLTTHLLDVAQELADRIAIIHQGQLRALGSLADLRAQTGLPDANLEALFLALTATGGGMEVHPR